METEYFMKVVEVAKALRVSKMTIYRLIRDGSLGSITVGRSFRIPESEVRKYLVPGERRSR